MIDKMIEANKNLLDENKMLKRDIAILEKRINKALKIIEDNRKYNVIHEELENILKGIEEND